MKEKTIMKKETEHLSYISRENMKDLLEEANAREIPSKDIVSILSKGNLLYLVYIE